MKGVGVERIDDFEAGRKELRQARDLGLDRGFGRDLVGARGKLSASRSPVCH